MRILGTVLLALCALTMANVVNASGAADGMEGIACLRTRQNASSPSSDRFLTLPFYQPSVGSGLIDQVVTDMPYPISNRFTLHDSWLGTSRFPLIPIVHWRMQEYTGFTVGDLANGQRGHVDAYAKSGEQMEGRRSGFWMNTQNEDTALANGSISTNLGCWFQDAPYAKLFGNTSQSLDVSFDTGVHYASSGLGGHSQAYFQLIVKDLSGACGEDCTFSISVGYFGPDVKGATQELTIPDDTGTTNFPLTGAGLDAPHWITRMPDSMHFQTSTFSEQRVHFRLSPEQLILMRNDVARTFPDRAISTDQGTVIRGYSRLSANPLDYGVTLINVNGEVYDPCKSNEPPTNCPGAYAQLGMTVANTRVTTTIPHIATGVPSASVDIRSGLVFRNQAGDLYAISTNLGQEGSSLSMIAKGVAVDDPATVTGLGAQRVYFLDGIHHVHEAWRSGEAWQSWDMSAALGLPDAYSAPRAYTAADGSIRVFVRDILGHVHQMKQDASGWSTLDLSVLSGATDVPAAIGAPVGYQAGSADRVVYRGVGGQLVELYFWDGSWHAWTMTTTPGAVQAATDPRPFVDTEGAARVIYRDIEGAIHQLRTTVRGWEDTNVSSSVGVPPALGSPAGFVSRNSNGIVYWGIDQHLHQLVWADGSWSHRDMSALDGSLPVTSDPQAYVGSDDIPRIDYLGADQQLHEYFFQDEWVHRDF